ncbi:antibiotic biosynthesis monooxygenase family protein [Lacisediminihabitans sp.]|jgi:quinol monooxygenase YgiN|uniref:putative quinol monooxygenase n=1 Tax=Lacisediminihabitans sp. TaxID=2787631 RepID=UPI002F91C83B
MSVIVVATLTPAPGRTQDVLDAFGAVSPLVHEEPGCELYAAHTDGNLVIMVERWRSREDLDAHAAGAALVELNRLNEGALAAETVVHVLRNVPMGDPVKGTIQ